MLMGFIHRDLNFGANMRFFVKIAAILTICLAAFVSQPTPSYAEAWKVELTKKQKRRFEEISGKKPNTAFAISPDGIWGRSWGKDSAELAVSSALSFCRQHLKPGKRDCVLYSVNQKLQIENEVDVEVETVKEVFETGDPDSARRFFGTAVRTMRFDYERATTILKGLKDDPNFLNALIRDTKLEEFLRNRSLIGLKKAGSTFWFGQEGGERHIKGRKGLQIRHFKEWIATPEGLVCMLESFVPATGKKLGTDCIAIDTIIDGEVEFALASETTKKLRKAYLVNGDARFSATR